MRWYSKLFAAALAATLQACVTPPAQTPASSASSVAQTREPVTILISIDGFRRDYLDRGITPVMSALARDGAVAAMRPSFPSKTFPNHYTLVTGMRPDHHGIVSNSFYDPERPDYRFTMATDDPFYWDAAEPIWVAAEKAGIPTATMFWPGSNVKLDDVRPSSWQQFNQNITGRQRVDAIIDWLRRPEETRPRLLTLYFDTVDTAGHRFGPDAPELEAAVSDVDALIGRLVAGLDTLHQPANLVIVADHGMAEISADRIAQLQDYVDPQTVSVVETGAFAGLAPVEGHEAEVRDALLGEHPGMTCWERENIPARLHYGTNPRIPPIFCLADTGWTILNGPPNPEWPIQGGTHGYDSDAPEMLAVFVANGPDIARGVTLQPFDNVDVEPLLRRLIGLPQHDGEIDGSLAPVVDALAE
ncbi:alkaline phosphatase family protein [Stakelama tenebrarum]|uniref:Alkaline phosphatase family protein n=1 Tax=Stakelama tenebrarum TaxID=2711215 RepID=A0A6G6Y2I0_9SPHN|nr:ectonucleotide pyrophosphatase/phosphodiesterase [Sphingosinithalassobacter tenebrarum]QIG79132.1 alkaline phosphatase family protein [Sphingosinithalassobacter tenebrarum]